MIPKIIHYFWFGNNPIPAEQKKYIATWKKYCPDYEIKFWNENNYDIHQNQYMEQAYKAGKYGFVPDYARLDIVYQYGGFYLDTDVELIKSLDGLREYSVVMGFERYADIMGVATGQGFGAEKGSPAIKELMNIYRCRNFIKRDGTYNLQTSTTYVTNYLKGKGLKTNGEKQEIIGITILPEDYFGPLKYSANGNKLEITENTYSIHHLAASWKEPVKKRKSFVDSFLRNIKGR